MTIQFNFGSRLLLLSLCSSLGTLAYSWSAFAEGAASLTAQLPPPPPTPNNSNIPSSSNTTPEVDLSTIQPPSNNFDPSSSEVREFNFKAPESVNYSVPNTGPNYSAAPTPPPIPTVTEKRIEFYRVEVTGKDESLLSEVKKIEPFAFIVPNQEAIYAGLFTDQQDAQKRVQELTTQGFSAQIVPINYSVSSSYSITVQP